jgi:heme/copper-type cytochrome/quinol oxidase subunit 2
MQDIPLERRIIDWGRSSFPAVSMTTSRSLIVTVACLGLLGSPTASVRARTSPYQTTAKEFTITARRTGFSPAKIEVNRGDLVKITLMAEDIPHSFTIDSYRVSKRAAPGQNVTIELHADTLGTHTFYCSLSSEDCCRNMRGELVVR